MLPFLLLILTAVTAPAISAAAQGVGAPLPPPHVAEVRFTGVDALHLDTLRAAMGTQGVRCRSPLLAPACVLGDWRWAERQVRLDSAQLARDEEAIRALYAARGYPHAEVQAEVIPRSEGQVAIRFHVCEGPPQIVRSVEVRGEELPPGVELPELPLAPGVPYSLARLEEAERRIRSRLAEAGYPFAQVEVGGSVEGDSADVTLEVMSGPRGIFGPAEVAAEPPLAEAEVRRRLAFHPGEPFDPAALERTLERLYALPIVENVSVLPAPSPAREGIVVPRIVVETGRVQATQADFTVGSSDCLSGTGRWGRRHFLGEPRVVSLSVGATNLLANLLSESLCAGIGPGEFADPGYFVSAEWREPVGLDSWLSLSAAFERLAVARAYVRRGVRGRVAFARSFGGGWSGELAYAPE
ncbi:MAG TPA: POTRA domain-containing protein, partial [Longimicrobiaceae bacterium]|nr:POTRA domain-containing protein [Longimicrobiaceae bacterium]